MARKSSCGNLWPSLGTGRRTRARLWLSRRRDSDLEDHGQHVKGGIMDLVEYAAVLARIADEMRRNRKAYDELDEQHLRSLRSGGLPTVGTMATLQAEWARLDREYDSIREMHQTLSTGVRTCRRSRLGSRSTGGPLTAPPERTVSRWVLVTAVQHPVRGCAAEPIAGHHGQPATSPARASASAARTPSASAVCWA